MFGADDFQGSRVSGHYREIGYACDEFNEARWRNRSKKLGRGVVALIVLLMFCGIAVFGYRPLTGNEPPVTLLMSPVTIGLIILISAFLQHILIAPKCSKCGKRMRKEFVAFSPSHRCEVFQCDDCRLYCDTHIVSE